MNSLTPLKVPAIHMLIMLLPAKMVLKVGQGFKSAESSLCHFFGFTEKVFNIYIYAIHKYIKETNADMSGSHKCNSKAHSISVISKG